MEMSYGGTLVMPKSYAVMDQEEMCYVEGGLHLGKHKWNKNGVVSFGIDCLVSVIPALAALNNLVKVGKLAKAGRVYIRENIDDALRRVGIGLGVSVLNSIINVILTAVGTSIGGVIVWGINQIDGKRNDGYCFA